jgi:AcrR family transcriptional regulator
VSNRRRKILDAFRRRLRHYGYDKTTMAEIAADVGISVGTLYLEFESKQDILAGLVEETSREFDEVFRAIADSERPAGERLKDLLQARVALSDRCCRQAAHSEEVMVAAADKCRQMKAAREARYLDVLERILSAGAATGDLDVQDPGACARTLRDALTAYLPPHSLGRPSEEVLAGAADLVEVLVRGLQAKLERV